MTRRKLWPWIFCRDEAPSFDLAASSGLNPPSAATLNFNPPPATPFGCATPVADPNPRDKAPTAPPSLPIARIDTTPNSPIIQVDRLANSAMEGFVSAPCVSSGVSSVPIAASPVACTVSAPSSASASDVDRIVSAHGSPGVARIVSVPATPDVQRADVQDVSRIVSVPGSEDVARIINLHRPAVPYVLVQRADVSPGVPPPSPAPAARIRRDDWVQPAVLPQEEGRGGPLRALGRGGRGSGRG